MIIFPEKTSHWYYPDGTPCHFLPKKDGSGMRPATVRDARLLGLLPSVSSVLRVMAKPSLESWKMEQAILSALTLPRLAGENDHDFAHRVARDSQEESRKAAEFGTRIHAEVERLLGGKGTVDAELDPYMKPVTDWIRDEVLEIFASERIVVHTGHGYAGKLDLHCRTKSHGLCIVDFKTQKIKNGEAVWYDEWYLQLAAYAKAVSAEQGNGDIKPAMLSLVSVLIDSTKPGPVHVHQWPDPDYGFFLFLCAVELWRFSHHYDHRASKACWKPGQSGNLNGQTEAPLASGVGKA